MRRRITYIQPPHAPFHPSQTTLTPNTLTITNLAAAREERITLGFNELSGEVCCPHPLLLRLSDNCAAAIWSNIMIADLLYLDNSSGRS
jgi:hypothetical protein